jgi:hypothetical protein
MKSAVFIKFLPAKAAQCRFYDKGDVLAFHISKLC